MDPGSSAFLHTYGDGILVIDTGISGGPIRLDIDLGHDTHSPFGHIDVRSGTLLVDVDLDPTEVELPNPGIYRVAVSATGRDAAPDLQTDDVVETYRLVLEHVQDHSFGAPTPLPHGARWAEDPQAEDPQARHLRDTTDESP